MPRRTFAPLAFAPPQNDGHPLTISQFRAWRIKEPDSGRRYTVIKLQSRDGTAGFGEGAATAAPQIAEAKAAIAGRRATETEFVRAHLAHLPALEAAVSNAMIDLVSRSRKLPIYQFLGGPTRFKARLLARFDASVTDEATIAAPLERAKRLGILAFTMPALQRDAMIPLQQYVDQVRRRVGAIRSLGGPNSEWVLDGNAAMTPGDAATVAKALERDHLMWLDEPTAVLTRDNLAKITAESVMPVGLGRHIHEITTFQTLLHEGSLNILRPSLGLNSLAKLKRMAAVAETHYIAIAAFHALGPIGTLAGIHLNAAIPNGFAQEVPIPTSSRDAAMRVEITSGNQEKATQGYAALLNRPGLGVEINEQALNTYSEETI